MTEFKAGDRVKCIKGSTDGLVKTGEFYIITRVTLNGCLNGCNLKGLNDCLFMQTRFILAPKVKVYYEAL